MKYLVLVLILYTTLLSDNRSNQMNPNNSAYSQSRASSGNQQANPNYDNHSNQLNPNNSAYWQSRGHSERPNSWNDETKSNYDNHSNQMNPNNSAYNKSRENNNRTSFKIEEKSDTSSPSAKFCQNDVKDFKPMRYFSSPNEFDKAVKKQLIENSYSGSDFGVIMDYYIEQDVWNRELNYYYKKLYNKLNRDAKKQLKSSQESWLTTQILNRELLGELLEKFDFKKIMSMRKSFITDTKNRVILLTMLANEKTTKEFNFENLSKVVKQLLN